MRVGFIMSTEVGMKTQYLNWRGCLTPEMGVDAEWIVITWWNEGGFLERMPLLPHFVKTRTRARLQAQEGLRKGPYDALFVAAPGVIRSHRGAPARQPYFLTTDCTPKQLHAFGDLYGKYPSRLAFVESRKHQERCGLFQNAAGIFPWSHWAAQSFIADYGVSPDKVHVMPPGIDLQKWVAPQRETAQTTHILFVGGDFYRKGGDLLLQWARQTTRTDWQLHLVTREPLADVPPNVHVYNGLASNDARLMALYRQAHLFALPTRGDCYSIAGMEALASGLPVILGRTGGTGDVIRDGETGYLIAPGDQDALTSRLDFLLTHPQERAQMGCAARADAEARYDVTKNIRQTVDIMRASLSGS